MNDAVVTAEIGRLISAGCAGEHLRTVVAQKFPELTEQEFYAALQVATEHAENHLVKRRQSIA